jgi:hypothetical protein
MWVFQLKCHKCTGSLLYHDMEGYINKVTSPTSWPCIPVLFRAVVSDVRVTVCLYTINNTAYAV